ncbi:hypothetical protein EI94DRAFT_1700073 [Lactarius quietus]|nr:hypothetical protein EI94DRAFT_1700073 [Lactarius quietus]
MSGVAASIIRGRTLHNWAALPIARQQSEKRLSVPAKEVEKRRRENIGNVLWLTIDKKSMMTSPLLLLLSKTTGLIRASLETIPPSIPFGGINTVLMGDFHQFPPVANPNNTLYKSLPTTNDGQLGHSLFEQFDVVIKLEEQMTGNCTRDDIAEIRRLVLCNPDCDIPDFTLPPWDNAVLVTPRNGSRTFWNEHMLEWHCRKTGEVRYILYAHDRSNEQVLSQQQWLTIAHMKLEQTGHLPNKVELAIGMKTMVLMNIATNADLANGSRGIITDIILHPDEHVCPNNENTVYLQYPPAAVLFQPFNANNIHLPGLPQGIVPIFPTQKTFRLGG